MAAGKIGEPPIEEGQNFQYSVTTLGRLSTPEQFEEIVLKPKKGFDASLLMKLVPGSGDGYEGFAEEVGASVGVVSDAPEEGDAVLITRYLDFSLPYWYLLGRDDPVLADRLMDAGVVLLVRLHLEGESLFHLDATDGTWSPALIRWASSTSSSAVMRSTLPIS